ncbi:MAG: Zn-ribbon domain-containing OB-fold protein [Chloroflexi bacterium]|nr:Zn-ribbon domain-containing OB-fold protein [Chloroflexota bacterium]
MEVARHWRLRRQRYRLEGEVCPQCGAKLFPPRDVCPVCQAEAKTTYTFSGRGEVVSFTVVTQAPEGYTEQAPYVIALIRLEEGPMLTAQLTDLGDEMPYPGMPVEMVTRRLRTDREARGIILYGYKFRPVLQPSPASS